MHRTLGDGRIVDPIGGFNVYADEDPPTRNATQMRHEEANTFQEEIVNVILAAGLSLNAGTETIQEMIQLNAAIDSKISTAVAAEAAARSSADNGLQSQITANAGAVTSLQQLTAVMAIADGTVTPQAGSSSAESLVSRFLVFDTSKSGTGVILYIQRAFTLSGGPANYLDFDLGALGGSLTEVEGGAPALITIAGSVEVGRISGVPGGELRVFRLNSASFPNGTISFSASIVGTAQ